LKKEIKVIHIDCGLDWRGGQRQVLTLHNGLLKSGLNSILICNKNGELFKKNSTASNIYGFDFLGEFSLKSRKNIKELVLKHSPNIVHCHDSHSVGVLPNLPKTIKTFHTRRVSYPINVASRFFKYSKINFHIAVGDNIKNYLKSKFDIVYTVPSCIDTSRFNGKVDKKIFKKELVNIVFVGAFTKQKGIDILVKSYNLLSQKHPNLFLHLVGDGNLMADIKKMVSTYNLHSKVKFYGAIDDVEKFYTNANYAIVPSIDGEGSSGVIKEALSAGTTVIASDLKDNLDLFEDGVSGFFFKKLDFDNLFSLMDRLISNNITLDKLKVTNQAKNFDCSITIKKHIELYSASLLQ